MEENARFNGQARKRVIYVDDFNFNLLTMKNHLKKHYEVFPALSVNIMFDILQNVIPDLIMLDIQMPEVNGYEAIERLKNDSRYAKIPVVFVSSKNGSEDVIKSLSLGADAHVSKPFKIEQLLETLSTALNANMSNLTMQSGEYEQHDKPVILAVDDFPSVLKAIYYSLRGSFKVYTLANPEELKGYLKKVKPDLILLDYMLPDMNGFDLIPIIRELPEHKDTPIILLTSVKTSDNVVAAFKHGVCDYIVKPFEPITICEKVKKHLNME